MFPPPGPEPQRTSSQAEYVQREGGTRPALDRLARLQAEFENARRRAEREKAEFATMPRAAWSSSFFPCSTISSWR